MSAEWGLLLDAFQLQNRTFLLSFAITNLWGFIGYGIVFYNVVARHKSILPFWMHAFYLAHDSSIAVRALLAAPDHNYAGFLVGTGVAMAVWNFQEIYVILSAILHKDHRHDVWGAGTTTRAAFASAARQIAFWYATFNLAYEFLNGNPRGAPFFSVAIFTNIVFNAGVSEHWRTRRTREDCGGLLFVLVQFCSAANSFYPYNMWNLVSPDLYGSFWYHASGVVTLGITLVNFAWVYSLPTCSEVSQKRKAT